ncbi:MAG: hypothetical protein JWM11_1367 [Planctomycetaceae bacterium]|nr:hypothetical protein [Planctomycetaceae bacterium]
MSFRFSRPLLCILMLLMCASVFTSLPLRAEEAPPKFQKLYNGKDLEGWDCYQGEISAWKVNGDLLTCTKEGGGWLRTKKVYSDYVLKLEYKIPEGGNSGVGIRVPPTGFVHKDGMEIQILDDDAAVYKDLNPAQYCGSIYYQSPAKRGAIKKPGEWNSMEITCAGPHVKITLNGQVVNDVQLDTFTKAQSPNEYSPLADRPQVGFIALQSHGSQVDFRNVEVQELTKQSESGLQYFDIKEGQGAKPEADSKVKVHYTGWLTNGKKFDSSRDREMPIAFGLNQVIKGWSEGVAGMKVGGRRKLIIPAELGYGKRGAGAVIPPDATLVFDVELLEIQ